MLARLSRYKELRDGGAGAFEAGRQMDLTASTGQRYERWYRDQAGLPRRHPGMTPGLRPDSKKDNWR